MWREFVDAWSYDDNLGHHFAWGALSLTTGLIVGIGYVLYFATRGLEIGVSIALRHR